MFPIARWIPRCSLTKRSLLCILYCNFSFEEKEQYFRELQGIRAYGNTYVSPAAELSWQVDSARNNPTVYQDLQPTPATTGRPYERARPYERPPVINELSMCHPNQQAFSGLPTGLAHTYTNARTAQTLSYSNFSCMQLNFTTRYLTLRRSSRFSQSSILFTR